MGRPFSRTRRGQKLCLSDMAFARRNRALKAHARWIREGIFLRTPCYNPPL